MSNFVLTILCLHCFGLFTSIVRAFKKDTVDSVEFLTCLLHVGLIVWASVLLLGGEG